MKLESPIIPDSVSNFAKAVAALADSHDIKSFSMTVKSEKDFTRSETQCDAEMQINYSVKDGRGRPCKNLSVQVKSTSLREIIKERESY